MKFVYATDTHLKGRNPSSRTDDFPRAMLFKLEELCYVAKKIGAQAILHGGDLFDVPDVANTLIGEVANTIRKYDVPFYVVPGNHDLYGYQMKSLPQTALGVLERAGVVRLLTRDGGAEIFNDGTVKVAVQGQEYYADIDKGNALDYEFPSYFQADHKILIPHSMLVPKEFFPGVPCTLTKDVTTSADIVLVGHYHPGFDDHTIGTTRFINPGSMGRLDATKSSLNRIPQYLILDAQANQVLNVVFKDFKTAKPGIDVLDNSHLAANAQRQVQVNTFRQAVSQVRQLAHTDINTILLHLASQQSQPIEVIKAAKDAIVAAEQNDKATTATDGFVESLNHTHATALEVENFQSHPDTTVDLEQGLNAIVGQSDSGKTALMRAYRWVAYNEPKGSEFIRHGTNEARVRVYMSNGSWAERGRTRKSAGYYSVGHVEPNGTAVMDTRYEGFGNDVPIEVQNVLQMPKSNLGRGDAETLSMAYQLDAPFLISESASTKAAVIGRLTGVHLLDTAIAGIGTDHLRNKKALNQSEDQLAKVTEAMKQFDGLDQLGANIQVMELLITEHEHYDQKSDELMKIRSEIFNARSEIKQMEAELKTFPNVQLARSRMDKIEAAISTYHELLDTQRIIQDATVEITEVQTELKLIEHLPTASKRMGKLEDAIRIWTDLKVVQTEITEAGQEISGIIVAMQQLPDTRKMTTMIESLNKLITQRDALELLQEVLEEERTDINDLTTALATVTVHKAAAQAELNELLGSIDVCPLCLRPMEAHVH